MPVSHSVLVNSFSFSKLLRNQKMDALIPVSNKPHAVCIPLPFQSHITAMLKLAKILHSRGFHITFANTEYNHHRLLKSGGADSLKNLPTDFRFETISDGLPPSDLNVAPDIMALVKSVTGANGLVLVRDFLAKINKGSVEHPPVSCLVVDFALHSTLDADEEFGIPQVLLWAMSAAVLMIQLHGDHMVDKGYIPHDTSKVTTQHLHRPVDFIPGVKNIRLKDVPSFFWDGDDHLRDIFRMELPKIAKASAIVINTFDAMEGVVLDAVKSLLPSVHAIGPMHLLEEQIPNEQVRGLGSNLLEEHQDCLEWLDSKEPNSVVYVNFGSSTVMTQAQFLEFAWGLANSKHQFLWVIRDNLVIGKDAVLPAEFIEETSDRGMISGWCPQEQVLRHSSIAGFLTHCGWNSIMDAVCAGVPILTWPVFGDQMTNCRNASVLWDIGMEIDKIVQRDNVAEVVRQLMESEKGQEMKRKAMDWKQKAQESTKQTGTSCADLDNFIHKMVVQ